MNTWQEWRKWWLLALPTSFLIGLLAASPAAAHTELVDTTPGAGRQLNATPSVISLAFSGKVLKLGAALQVAGPGGDAGVGAPKLQGRTLSWPIGAELENGRYTVRWRVTAQDGHPMDGSFRFVLRAPVATTPSAAETSAGPTPASTPHTASPEMTGSMEGMEGMPGMEPAVQSSSSSLPTGVAVGGVVLLLVAVIGAVVIERRRRPRPGADPSGTPSD